jgi:hypothetical protein
MSKYYTPEIEEFHVGFEFEYRNIGGEWEVRSYPVDSYVHITQSLIDIDCIRVKYLDREDIESLLSGIEDLDYKHGREGLPIGGYSGWKEYEFCIMDHLSFRLIYADENRNVLIENVYSDGSNVIFNGKIKNKSELRRVLKMVGVI